MSLFSWKMKGTHFKKSMALVNIFIILELLRFFLLVLEDQKELNLESHYYHFQKPQADNSSVNNSISKHHHNVVPSFLNQQNKNMPEWLFRNKIIPGLNCFVTLGEPDDDMKVSDLNKIDIEHLVDESNYNLNKFFDESEKKEYLNRATTAIPRKNSSNMKFNSGTKRNNGFKNPAKSDTKASFFKDYLTQMLDNHLYEASLNGTNKFYEFEGNDDLHKNLENFLFLEENKNIYETEFSHIYMEKYKKLLEKLKSTLEHYRVTPESLVKILYDDFCSTIFELYIFIKKCNSEYCFNIMKNVTEKNKINQETKPQSNPTAQYYEPNPLIPQELPPNCFSTPNPLIKSNLMEQLHYPIAQSNFINKTSAFNSVINGSNGF